MSLIIIKSKEGSNKSKEGFKGKLRSWFSLLCGKGNQLRSFPLDPSLLLYLVFFVGFVEIASAATRENLFEKGISAYDQKQYKEAIQSYEELVKDHSANADVLYNLASAYYRDAQKGKAVAALLAAKSLRPRDPDIKANLKFIHDEGKDQLGVEKDQNQSSFFEKIVFWKDYVSFKELTYGTLFFFSFGMLCVAFFLWFSKFLFFKILGSTFLSLALLCGLALGSHVILKETWGATTVSEAEITSGPGEHNTVVFKLREGAPFKLLMREGEWLKIEISDGRRGWIAEKDASVIQINSL